MDKHKLKELEEENKKLEKSCNIFYNLLIKCNIEGVRIGMNNRCTHYIYSIDGAKLKPKSKRNKLGNRLLNEFLKGKEILKKVNRLKKELNK